MQSAVETSGWMGSRRGAGRGCRRGLKLRSHGQAPGDALLLAPVRVAGPKALCSGNWRTVTVGASASPPGGQGGRPAHRRVLSLGNNR